MKIIEKNKILLGIIISSIILIGFLLRFLNFSSVVTDNMVQLKGADAYFFTRQAQLINEFGDLPAIDQNICFPDGYANQREAILYPFLISALSGLGSIDSVTAYLSPILALIVSVFVLLILIELMPHKWNAILVGVGVISFTGIQYLARSYFGFGDRHILEVALLTIGLYFLIKAWNRENIYWAVASGVAFALYQLTWSQTSLVVLLLVISIFAYYLFTPKVSKKFTIINIIFLALQIPAGIWANYEQSIGISLIGIVIIISGYFINIKLKKQSHKLWSTLVIAILGLIIANIFFGEFTSKLSNIIFGFLGPKTDGPVVSEAQPMLSIYSEITLLPPNVVFFQLTLFALSLWGFVKMLNGKNLIIALFGLFIAALSFHRIRSEYYFVVLSAISLSYLTLTNPKLFKYFIILIIGFALTFYISWVGDLKNQQSSLAFTSADYKMANWMKENLPAQNLDDPSRVGVLADWQLGYLYTYIASQPLLAEPNFCNNLKPIEFFLMQDEEKAFQYAKDNRIKYIITKELDYSKYYYYLSQTGASDDFGIVKAQYFGKESIYYDQEYYQRMFSRLYNFNGLGSLANDVYTIDKSGQATKYSSFEEARKSSPGSTYYSNDNKKSSVPLNDLKHFKLVHVEADLSGGVKLFEVLD